MIHYGPQDAYYENGHIRTVNLHYVYLNHFISHQLARLNPQERFVLRKQTCRIAYFNTT